MPKIKPVVLQGIELTDDDLSGFHAPLLEGKGRTGSMLSLKKLKGRVTLSTRVTNSNRELVALYSELVRFLVECCSLRSVHFKGKRYLPYETLWYGADPGKRPSYDPHVVYTGDMEHEWEAPPKRLKPKRPDEVKYELSVDISEVDPPPDTLRIGHQLYKELMIHLGRGHTLADIVLDRTVLLVNPEGVNRDHRGSDHCQVELPFQSKVEVKQGQSLVALADGLWRAKSHKFENWYEWVSGVDIVKLKGDIAELTLWVDHGS